MGPLSGLSVCDLTQNLAGPFCAQILADLGATVVKVEPPGGDPARVWGPPFWGTDGMLFLSANRGKRSIVLDLKTGQGRGVLRDLVVRSDVFLQSSRLGVPKRLGYDYESIRAMREDIIYLSLTAFGDRGPMSELPGYEPLIQAFAGMMSLTGHPDGPPARVGGSVVDFGTGMWSAIAILGALRTRDATGGGANLDTALLDTALGWVSYHIMGFFASGEVPSRMGSALASITPYQAFSTSDGHVMITGGNDAMFLRLCKALHLSELAEDPRFESNPARVANREALLEILEPRIRGYHTETLMELMGRHSVPCSPIQNIGETVRHPQVRASDMLTTPHPDREDYHDVSVPLRIDGERPRSAIPVPHAGAHSIEILKEMGYEDRELDELLTTGAVQAFDGTPKAGQKR